MRPEFVEVGGFRRMNDLPKKIGESNGLPPFLAIVLLVVVDLLFLVRCQHLHHAVTGLFKVRVLGVSVDPFLLLQESFICTVATNSGEEQIIV